jgi:hypothetical protein
MNLGEKITRFFSRSVRTSGRRAKDFAPRLQQPIAAIHGRNATISENKIPGTGLLNQRDLCFIGNNEYGVEKSG